jgi:hypothetical protein
LHQFPRQPFGGKVHIFGYISDGHGSILVQVKRVHAVIIFGHLAGSEAEPAGSDTKENYVTAYFYDCLVVGVQSVRRTVGSDLGGEGRPEFGVKILRYGIHL